MPDDKRDLDPSDGRNESVNQRMDRNWNELLQEMRVTQTGTQILGGFLLTIVFQPKFAQLDTFQQVVYLGLVVGATLTTALALAPVHLHRSLFRSHSKAELVTIAHAILRVALAGLALVITGTVLLIFDVATGDLTVALMASGAILGVLIALGVLPVLARKDWVRRRIEQSIQRSARSTSV